MKVLTNLYRGTGTGLYTNYVTITTGAIYFCALMSCQAIAIVMPAVGCDLKLSDATKGSMASMTFTGNIYIFTMLHCILLPIS